MKWWAVSLKMTCMNGDGWDDFVIEAETAGDALNTAVGTLNKDMGGGLVGWRATCVSEAHHKVLTASKATAVRASDA